jgi:pimeloyl-ACP methyl ester carboxylesterase
MSKLHRSLLLVLIALFCYSSALAQDQYFNSNGVKIRFIVEGKGEPVVLIHGFTSSLDANWRLPGIMRALSADHQVIAFDCRGHGKSDKPHEASKYGLEMVEDAIRLLDHLKIKKAHFAGYSMGGMITVKLVTLHADRVISAILGGNGGMRDNPGTVAFLDGLANSLESGNGAGPLANLLRPQGQAPPTQEQEKEQTRRLAAVNDSKALAAVVRGWRHLAIDEASAKAIRIPMIAIIGGQDPLKNGVDELKKWKPEMKVIVIEGANHLSAVMSPELIKGMKECLAANKAAVSAVQKNRVRLTALTTPIAAATR